MGLLLYSWIFHHDDVKTLKFTLLEAMIQPSWEVDTNIFMGVGYDMFSTAVTILYYVFLGKHPDDIVMEGCEKTEIEFGQGDTAFWRAATRTLVNPGTCKSNFLRDYLFSSHLLE